MSVEIKLDWKSDFPRARKAALVTDSNVDRLHGDEIVRQIEDTGLQVERIVFPAGEKSKTLETYAELVRGFAALELTRTDFAIALGGGVVGDLTGFAAATYMPEKPYPPVHPARPLWWMPSTSMVHARPHSAPEKITESRAYFFTLMPP